MPQSYYDSPVSPDADDDAIANAYLRVREQHHPKNNPGDPLAAEIVRYLDTTLAVLIEPERRRAYDEALLNGHSANGVVTLDIAPPAAAALGALALITLFGPEIRKA
jgi:DnaJ-class molecular chaperone